MLESLKRLEAKRPFSEREAWNVFRLAALAEAVGWTLLLAAILIQKFHLPGQRQAVPIAGQVHGTFFIAYFIALIATYSSLRWRRRTVVVAALAGVPPYGTLVFEQIAARQRRKRQRLLEHRIVARALIVKDGSLLAWQPAEQAFWTLPGVAVPAAESPQKSLTRKVFELTHVEPKLGALRFVAQTKRHGRPELDLYFAVENSHDFNALDLSKIAQATDDIDDLRFIATQNEDALEPSFLNGLAAETLLDTAAPVAFY